MSVRINYRRFRASSSGWMNVDPETTMLQLRARLGGHMLLFDYKELDDTTTAAELAAEAGSYIPIVVVPPETSKEKQEFENIFIPVPHKPETGTIVVNIDGTAVPVTIEDIDTCEEILQKLKLGGMQLVWSPDAKQLVWCPNEARLGFITAFVDIGPNMKSVNAWNTGTYHLIPSVYNRYNTTLRLVDGIVKCDAK